MAELTLPWAVYRMWLPSVAVSVNLGLDAKFGSGPVIQAMLVGLRDAYNRIFTSWTAGPANLGRLGAILGLLVLVTLAGDTWFRVPTTDNDPELDERAPVNNTCSRARPTVLRASLPTSICGILPATLEVRTVSMPDLVCRLGEGWFDLLYLDLVPDQLKRETRAEMPHPYFGRPPSGKRLLLNGLLPFRDRPRAAARTRRRSSRRPELHALSMGGAESFRHPLHLYHVFLFFGLLVLGRNVLRRIPLLPYHQNLQRIDDLLDSMSSRTKVTERPRSGSPRAGSTAWSRTGFARRNANRRPTDGRAGFPPHS